MAIKKQFLDIIGLNTFLTGLLKSIFASQKELNTLKTNTDPYIFEIDYENTLKFNTDLIVSGEATSPIIDIGQVGFMVIAES